MFQKSVFVFLAFHRFARARQLGKNHLVLGGGGFKTFFQFPDFLLQFFKRTFVLGGFGGNGALARGVGTLGRIGVRKSLLFEFLQELGDVPVSVKLIVV